MTIELKCLSTAGLRHLLAMSSAINRTNALRFADGQIMAIVANPDETAFKHWTKPQTAIFEKASTEEFIVPFIDSNQFAAKALGMFNAPTVTIELDILSSERAGLLGLQPGLKVAKFITLREGRATLKSSLNDVMHVPIYDWDPIFAPESQSDAPGFFRATLPLEDYNAIRRLGSAGTAIGETEGTFKFFEKDGQLCIGDGSFLYECGQPAPTDFVVKLLKGFVFVNHPESYNLYFLQRQGSWWAIFNINGFYTCICACQKQIVGDEIGSNYSAPAFSYDQLINGNANTEIFDGLDVTSLL